MPTPQGVELENEDKAPCCICGASRCTAWWFATDPDNCVVWLCGGTSGGKYMSKHDHRKLHHRTPEGSDGWSNFEEVRHRAARDMSMQSPSRVQPVRATRSPRQVSALAPTAALRKPTKARGKAPTAAASSSSSTRPTRKIQKPSQFIDAEAAVHERDRAGDGVAPESDTEFNDFIDDSSIPEGDPDPSDAAAAAAPVSHTTKELGEGACAAGSKGQG